MQLVHFQKGDFVCLQGQALDFLAFLVSGRLKAVSQLENGKEHIIETLEPSAIIGDIELLLDQKASLSIIAMKDCSLVLLPITEKDSLFKDALFLYHLSRNLAQNLYKQSITTTANVLYSVKERLATYILEEEQDLFFQLDLSDLADQFGTSYRHLLRVIKQFIDLGVITKIAYKQYYICDLTFLKSLQIKN
ncbi:hypothetical protein HMPREF9318_01861 [Streptococcus urinalis FB127-CNA-2]|uniref:Cyclic nucleotide-binding domain protein n=1 Tax=Streptococcus urinalis 2285-97 TaxID=764291 RepID=G5KDQ5_9STRE|nr:cyclic nucleotide-binding domain-containing protein [Streptococcus urinalis]EHJ55722.1 cyclic nucleotide-binding domain protein [Streptococcus urinalis 2285-97]EKS17412.1 hypothetical protein HMPREF9318_01861 [Streptococcus urinalis FB127-CNA-2]VEF32765.1 cyclic nucleotide-binding domain-containing protein [Streptococcus urinalis]